MEKPIRKSVRNSELAVAKEKRIFLTYPAYGLAPCALEEAEDSVGFVFSTEGMDPASAVMKMPKWERLRFLINCASFESLTSEYSFSLSMDNLIIDMNLVPKLLIRDARVNGGMDFLQCYKGLIGSVIFPKYKYEDYISGGQDKYEKHKLLRELAGIETAGGVKGRLYEEYCVLMDEVNDTKKLVPKKNAIGSRIAIPALTVALAAALFFGGRMFLMDIPFRDSVIEANTAYIHGDFLSVQNALRNYDLPALSVETRHILSRAYVFTEALTITQRDNILIGLARLTDPIIFDYWILLGRLRFEEAVDIAQRLGDDELLLFAYLKQEAFVRQDMAMPGDERAALLAYLENSIDSLNRAREEAMNP